MRKHRHRQRTAMQRGPCRGKARRRDMKRIAFAATFLALAMPAQVLLHAQLTGTHPTKEPVQPQRLSEHELTSTDQHTADILEIEQLWAAYAFYNDTHNGPGMASLFTEDAVWRGASNNGR